MSKAIFIDVDGPMIPMRAYYLPQQTAPVSIFDPCAVSLLLRLVDAAQAKLVVSSTWGYHGYDSCMEDFEKNGISSSLFHKDWITPRKMSSSRAQEIRWWLDRHPETTHSVAIDDEDLHIELVPCAVKCDGYEGMSWRNYLECFVHLDAFETLDTDGRAQTISQIEYFKRREIWRTKRSSEPGAHLRHVAADIVFPPNPPNNDEDVA